MPVHKIPAASIHEDLQDIERQGELIRQVTRIDYEYFLVLTDKPTLNEITHAARLGAIEQRAKWDRDGLLHSFITDDVVRDA